MKAGAVVVVVASAALGLGGAAVAFDVTSVEPGPSAEQPRAPRRPARATVEVPVIVPGTVFAWAPCPATTVRRGTACVRAPVEDD